MPDKRASEKNHTWTKTEEIYHILLEKSPDPIFAFSSEGRYLYVNLAFAEGVGKTIEQILGKTIWDVFAPEEAAQRFAALQYVFQSGEEKVIEVCVPRPDRDRYFITTITPVIDNEGKVNNVICSSKDITERKCLEKNLAESEEKYRLLVTKMTQGLAFHEVIFDEAGQVVDYRFLDVNDSFEEMTGLRREDILGKTVLEVMPETESYWIEKYGRVAMTGEALQYQNYARELDRYYEVLAYCPRHLQFAVIMTDITDRKQMEKLIFEEKERLKTTLLSVGDGVIATDNQGAVVLFNQIAEQLTGWSQTDAIGKSLEEVFHIIQEYTRSRCPNPVQKVMETGNIVELANHTLLISKEGIERPIEDTAAPIRDVEGNIQGVVLVFRDFSEKREKQREIAYLSFHDQLTGLYNRRFFEEELKRLDIERNYPLTLVISDVNGLKLTNDAFGHLLGDKLLQKAAEVMKKEIRADDIIARIGGDEFVILLPQTNSEQAGDIVSRINSILAEVRLESIILSISFGWATKEMAGEDMTGIFKKAEDNMYRHKLSESSSMRNKTIKVITKTLYEKNEREEKHSFRVSKLCENIGLALDLSVEDINELRTVGLMHDIGKIAIDDHILDKDGELDESEWLQIKRHSETGYRILSSVNEYAQLAEYVLAHHERWDGNGYPKGLKGQSIPLVARIIAVADSYDAMTSDRPYRKALSREFAMQEITRNSGTQFDPDIVSVFAAGVWRE